MPLGPSGNSVETMASLIPLSPYLSPTVLLLVSCDLDFVRADRPPSPVNVTLTSESTWPLCPGMSQKATSHWLFHFPATPEWLWAAWNQGGEHHH
ncbi:hypothetical protein LEMLEM_LOCUS11603 [Lemmus lemmus]